MLLASRFLSFFHRRMKNAYCLGEVLNGSFVPNGERILILLTSAFRSIYATYILRRRSRELGNPFIRISESVPYGLYTYRGIIHESGIEILLEEFDIQTPYSQLRLFDNALPAMNSGRILLKHKCECYSNVNRNIKLLTNSNFY